jgi:hypothetical protein
VKKKDRPIKNNPVAKHAPEFCKPKTFSDRKKHPSKKDEYRDHPLHEPYDRSKAKVDRNNYLIEDEENYGSWDMDAMEEEYDNLEETNDDSV